MLRIFREKIEQSHLTDRVHCDELSAEEMAFPSRHFDIIASTV